ncbi:MAG: hypothetical protein IKQ80_07610 [Clostridia bacterium]|nr:hypothetical protein [Clostridia bacterium]
MTERLYYDDAYLTEFDARVEVCVPRDGAYHARLDRSAFYPTSGGQPYDTGTLNGAAVIDVYVGEDGDVWHVLKQPLNEGEAVHGVIDWPRRFDHMQQHAGDHMIASALWRHMGGVTIGLHVSREVSTIDVAMPGGATHLSEEAIARIEDDVNVRIQRDVPIRCWFPSPDELRALPLRKPPTVAEHVRVVAIGEDEMVACGGTHPATAGQLGLVKITGVAPARGKLRVSFLAGMRAYNDYREKYGLSTQASNLLSTSVQNLPGQLSALQAELHETRLSLNRLRRDAALNALCAGFEEEPALPDGTRVVARMLEGDAALIKEVASQLIRRKRCVALLGAKAGPEGAVFVFARSQDVDLPMGRLLTEVARPLGGKGGGRPDFAQGGGPEAILDAAVKKLLG